MRGKGLFSFATDMSISAAERKKIPAEDFAGPHRTFPIRNQQDVYDAARLIGHAQNPDAVKARIMAICKRKGLKLPDAWMTKEMGGHANMSTGIATATFALSHRTEEGDFAVYRGVKVFEAGEFPDKGIDVSPEQLWLMADTTGRINGNLEHSPHLLPFAGTTVALDGELGYMENPRLDEDGTTLRADVFVPLWLDRKLPQERGVSVEFKMDDPHSLTGYALTTKPRIPDAVLMSAYADHAGMSEGTEETTVSQAAPTKEKKENKRMSFMEELKSLFSKYEHSDGSDPGDEHVDPVAAPPAQAAQVETPAPVAAQVAPAAEDSEKLALLSRIEQMEQERRVEKSTAYVDGQINETRLLPAMRDSAIALFTAAYQDDAAGQGNVVTFSNGQKLSRVDALKTFVESLPKSAITDESTPAWTFSNATPLPERTEERKEIKKDELLARTALGRQVLSAQRNGGSNHKEN